MDERKEALVRFCSCDVPGAGKPGADGPEMEAAEGRRPEAGSLPHPSLGCSCHNQGFLGPSTLSFCLPILASCSKASHLTGSFLGVLFTGSLGTTALYLSFSRFCRTEVSINSFCCMAWPFPSALSFEDLLFSASQVRGSILLTCVSILSDSVSKLPVSLIVIPDSNVPASLPLLPWRP